MTQDLEELTKWIGRKQSGVDYVTIPLVHRLAATLDREDPMPKHGDLLPIGWHLVLFPHVVRHSQLGSDGQNRGEFLPPVPLPHRMLAGMRVTFVADFRVGDEVRRESIIKNVTTKQGRTGRMVFVTVKADISSPRGLAVTEETDFVYRSDPDPNARPPAPQPAPGRAVWSKAVTPDPVLLFRYSALTFDTHRIHYDHPYATKVEGYPDLVTNGRLTMLLVFELTRAHAATPLRSISSRNIRPLFVNQPFTVCGKPSPDSKTAKLWAVDNEKALALSATAEFG